MNALKIKTPIAGVPTEVEAKQSDPLHPRFEIRYQGTLFAILQKVNGFRRPKMS